MANPSVLRSSLDRLYWFSGAVAACFLIAILGLILIQMLARWTGEVFPGAPDYAGYCMAAASFFAFAHALNSGSHIRVGIVLNAVGAKARRVLEIWCFGIGSALAWYAVYYAGRMVYWSWKFGDVSQGQDATPLWIPQMGMMIGLLIFAIALTDNLVNLFTKGSHFIGSNSVESANSE